MTTSHELLVDGAWLARHRGDDGVVLLDTRPADQYWAGHLDGARHFDALAISHRDTSPAGLDTLVAHYAYLFSLLGLAGDEHVVVYEARSDARAARAVWLLHYLGHPRVSLLDGGLDALQAPVLSTQAQAHAARRFVARPRDSAVVGADALHARLHAPQWRVLDTRRRSEFTGEERRASRAGAIPGALHHDYTDNIGSDGRFKPAHDIRDAYLALGLRPSDHIATYCGGGARAAHSWLALRLAGFEGATNYTGSWNEWAERADLPVQRPVPAGACADASLTTTPQTA